MSAIGRGFQKNVGRTGRYLARVARGRQEGVVLRVHQQRGNADAAEVAPRAGVVVVSIGRIEAVHRRRVLVVELRKVAQRFQPCQVNLLRHQRRFVADFLAQRLQKAAHVQPVLRPANVLGAGLQIGRHREYGRPLHLGWHAGRVFAQVFQRHIAASREAQQVRPLVAASGQRVA